MSGLKHRKWGVLAALMLGLAASNAEAGGVVVYGGGVVAAPCYGPVVSYVPRVVTYAPPVVTFAPPAAIHHHVGTVVRTTPYRPFVGPVVHHRYSGGIVR